MARTLIVGVLVSGEGTTFDGLCELVAGGHLPVQIALVVSDRPHTPAIERARRRGLSTLVLPTHGAPEEAWTRRLTAELDRRGVEVVVLAGFLTILPDAWVHRWRGRAINVHPSLLPRYGGTGMYGGRIHRAVLEAGDRETGATVHLVTSELDRGPVIAQARMDVRPGDTPEDLRARLHPLEVTLLAETLRRFAEGLIPLPYPVAGPSTGAPHGEAGPAP